MSTAHAVQLLCAVSLLAAIPPAAYAKDAQPTVAVIPLPNQIAALPGQLRLPRTVTVVAPDDAARDAAAFVVADLTRRGIAARIVSVANGVPVASAPSIELRGGVADPQLGDEGYRLRVDASGVSVAANTGAGLFYGAQTLGQLLVTSSAHETVADGVSIVDRPRFRWRGIHLDVSRHFFAVPVVEQFIDVASRYKLNRFHWHLTDDQGWRMPIPGYPLLTSVGGCRSGSQVGPEGSTTVDHRRYCGAYTTAQIREVVAYAARRHVTVLPEIEMPGHSVEALTAYPWLGCGAGPFAVRTLWGVSTEIFCPKERTFAFLDDVIREVAREFPGADVHIGGDEVPKDAWRRSPDVAELMRREHIASVDAVQGYFTRRVERIAAKYGKRIAGWDEVLEGGVSQRAIVFAWRGMQHGVAAAKRGNDVVMTPDPLLYLDAYQGNPAYEPLAIGGLTTTRMIYAFDPLPPGLDPAAQAHVLGAQVNVWTEYIPTAQHVFYMTYPRALALAEITWTAPERRDWQDFSARLGPALGRLYDDGVPFRVPNVTFRVDAAGIELPEQQSVANRTTIATSANSAGVALAEIVPGATIRYTTDGSLPSARSPEYTAPLHVDVTPSRPTVITAVASLRDGRHSAPAMLELTAASH